MKSTKVASRYAKALLEIAIEQNKIDAILGDMQFISKANEETHDFELLIASPIITADKKISIFEIVFDQFEEASMSFIKLITNNGREAYLPQIAQSFDDQVKEHRGIVPITVVSATKLENSTKDAILAKVQATVTGTLEVTEEIDDSLIGGFVVRMGDTQIDASVANQFNNLKQRLTR
ncbi:MAG: ATP synthase F1 subunit delta [Crocinitomicaceae bacterium]|nr:ATP synthase F1 subunit delta [Crocinitomicaceae bacterium]